MTHMLTSYLELELEVEYDFEPADPGNPDIESRTCCPPSAASATVVDVFLRTTADNRVVSIMACLSQKEIELLEQEALESHED